MNLEKILATAQQAAKEAAKIVIEARTSGGLGVTLKETRNPFTQADVDAEKIVVSHILKEFPTHQILAEESYSEMRREDLFKGDLWIIDPIDGTVNFIHGHYQSAISIAYAKDGVVQMGLVYGPFYDELFIAVRGQGATCNGKAIKASECRTLVDALVATGFPYAREDDFLAGALKRLGAVLKNCQDIRRIGACSLDICWVACGRLDAYYESVQPWDMAAASLIAKEAGAMVGHFGAVPDYKIAGVEVPEDLFSLNMLVAAPGVFEKIRELLR